jgi:AsmA protein
MTRIFAAAGLIVAGFVLFALALGWLLLPMLSGAGIKEAVARDTGRSITFAGRPRLSLWPDVAIELRAVELSNPADMFEGRVAAADTVRLKVSGASLWRRAPEIAEIIVVRPRINLVVDGDGRSNFAFEHDGEEAAQAPPIVVVDGSLKYLNERSGAVFAASDVDVTLSRSGLSGPLELDGAFNWNDQRLTIAFHAGSSARLVAEGSPADFTIAGPYLNAAFSGRAALKEGIELAGTLRFEADPLADLLSWAGHPSDLAASLPALSASGALDFSRGAIRITQGRFAFGRMNARGDVVLDMTGAKPRLDASLGLDRIDVSDFAGDLFQGAGWSEAPVDLEILKLFDAELSLAATQMVYGRLLAGAARLDVTLQDGALEAALLEADVYGGSASGRLTLDGSGPMPALEATLKALGLDAGELGGRHVRGQADVDFDLAARGATPQEFVARLGGRVHLRLRKGELEVDVPAMLGHVASEVADGWTAAGAGDTPFTWLEANFAVADGIAETADLKLRGPVAAVNGTGSVDLLSRRIDLRVRPLILDPDGKEPTESLPVAVVIAGSWSAPKIYPDVAGMLEDPAKAYETLGKRIRLDAAKLDLGPPKGEKELDDTGVTR